MTGQNVKMQKTYAKGIEKRTFEFALQIIDLAKTMQRTAVAEILMRQLVRSGTSIGANVEESQAGYSRDEFSYKMNIALKESREACYWLRLVEQAGLARSDQISGLLDEAEQIKKILGSIVSKTRGKSK